MSAKIDKLRLYVVFRPDISPMAAFIAYGHATLGTYLTWKDDPIMQEWQATSFVKVPLAVSTLEEYKLVKTWGEHRIFTESSMDNMEMCAGFRVVRNVDARFKTLKLYSLLTQ